jgi:NAD+ synthase (glutamine-hydrolysing)
MKIAIVQLNPLIGDFKRQFDRIANACEKSKALGCDLAVCPELALCGYPPHDLLEHKAFVQAGRDCLFKLIRQVHGIGVICGFVDTEPEQTGHYNSAVLFESGRILHHVNKQLLPAYDVFDERRRFEPGAPSHPLEYKGARIGLTICEDAWNDKAVFGRDCASDPVTRLAGEGIDLLINISASPFYQGRRTFREGLLSGIAKKHRMPVVFVNQVGGNDHVLFDGASAVFDRGGDIVARCRDFDEDLIVYDTADGCGDLHPVSRTELEGVLRALVMGTRDYMVKCGFDKAVVGLSGGVDSALVVYIAAQALGSERVTGIFMPSRHTSPDSYEDARRLAENLGVGYSVMPIDRLYDDFVQAILPANDSSEPSVTEQNIQSRVRGTLLMGISNRDGSLVLSTGNKSELAVGYCTLYGDMNGGLAVLADVYKTLVYDIGRLINAHREVIPQRILDKAPSAELKPNQTDQDDLPPYEVIDAVVKGYIEEGVSEKELVAAGHDPKMVEEIIRRIDTSEYKRQQAPPCLKVTPKAFGESRRYPLAKRFTQV